MYTGARLLCPENIELGTEIIMAENSSIQAENGIVKLGDRTTLGPNVLIDGCCDGEIVIGNDVMIARNTLIRSSNHAYNRLDIPMNKQGWSKGKTIIGNDVWIGNAVTITPNVKIGNGVIVGAGAVVTRDIDDYMIVGGVPAVVIGKRIQ